MSVYLVFYMLFYCLKKNLAKPFTANDLTCHSRKGSDTANYINDGSLTMSHKLVLLLVTPVLEVKMSALKNV